jgi:hypothetical protein
MRVAFNRSQSSATFSLVPLRIGGGVKFILDAKADLSEEERHLIQRYRIADARLVPDDPIITVKSAIRSSTILIIPIFIVLIIIFGYLTGIVLTFLAYLILIVFYYQQLRENIFVRDLINGRKFQCFSVVELIHKEASLEYLASYLRQLLESAAHWDDKEVIEIPPLSKEDAKLYVLKNS